MNALGEIIDLLDSGDRVGAVRRYKLFSGEVGGPGPLESDDSIILINRRLNVWEQISVFVAEADKSPENGRSWKLLGPAYARAGVYVPDLLRLAESVFYAAIAKENNLRI